MVLPVMGCAVRGAEVDRAAAPVSGPPWVADGAPAHSELVGTDNTVVFAVVENGKLWFVGRAVVDGRVTWRSEGDVGMRPPARRSTPMVRDGVLYHLALDESRSRSTMVAIEADTGRVQWRTVLPGVADDGIGSGPGYVTVSYRVAGGSFQWACLDKSTGQIQSGNALDQISTGGTSAGNAHVRPTDPPSPSPPLNFLSDPPRLSMAPSAGQLGWEKPIGEAFGGLPVSMDSGYARFHQDGVWTAWLGPRALRSGPNGEKVMPAGAAIGIDKSGAVRWRRGDRRPCALIEDPAGPLLCDGDTRAGAAGSELRPTVMERLDPHTGVAQWQLHLDGAWNVYDPATPIARIDEHQLVVHGPNGVVLVDLQTGPTTDAPPEGSTGWCWAPYGGEDELEIFDGGHRQFGRANPYYPCRPDGEAIEAPTASYVPTGATLETAAVRIWIGADGRVRGQPKR